ncbi:MAG: hypothetical protein AB7O62_14915 [Pirellulales bacterium]
MMFTARAEGAVGEDLAAEVAEGLPGAVVVDQVSAVAEGQVLAAVFRPAGGAPAHHRADFVLAAGAVVPRRT